MRRTRIRPMQAGGPNERRSGGGGPPTAPTATTRGCRVLRRRRRRTRARPIQPAAPLTCTRPMLAGVPNQRGSGGGGRPPTAVSDSTT